MELFFAIVILACLHSFVLPDGQGDALFALRNSLNASSDQLADWNQNQVSPCTWSKITCDDKGNVIMVSLSSMGFSGTLTPRIGVLKNVNTFFTYQKGKKRKKKVPTSCGIINGQGEIFGHFTEANSFERWKLYD